MHLFKQATHLLLPIMDSQTNCVFAQLTGQRVLHVLHDLHESICNVDTHAHIWNTRAMKTGIGIVT